MSSQVRTAILSTFMDVAQECGVDPFRLLSRHGLSVRWLSQPDHRLPAAQAVRLLEDAAALGNFPAFGLRMAELRTAASLGLMSLIIAHHTTLREVVTALMSYRPLLNEALVTSMEEHGDLVLLREDLLTHPSIEARQAYELGLGMITQITRVVLGAQWRPLTAHFAHQAPADLTVHRRVFGDGLVFNSGFYGLAYHKADMDRPNPAAQPEMVRLTAQILDSLPLARPESLPEAVKRAIYNLLQFGEPSLERVAGRLGLARRTLQRRLAQEGLTFSEVLDEVRRNLAIRYLANPSFSLLQVSEMLGYAQSSAFARWFSAQFGMPASRYRATYLRRGGPMRPAASDATILARYEQGAALSGV